MKLPDVYKIVDSTQTLHYQDRGGYTYCFKIINPKDNQEWQQLCEECFELAFMESTTIGSHLLPDTLRPPEEE